MASSSCAVGTSPSSSSYDEYAPQSQTRQSYNSTESFRQSGCKYVVLVHGFEDTTNASSCEIELKQWYRTADERLKGSSQPIRVVSFKFDMEAILKGAEDINAYSNQLGTFLLDLEPGKVEERPGLSEGHSKVMEDGRRSAQPQNMPSFVLVGHGIGCWVVREFCSERSYQTVAINTTGIIFLNDPATLGLENENEYVNFLGNFVRLCEFDPKDISLKDFGRLFKIDTAFRQVLQTSTSKIPRPSTTSNLSVWIPYSIEGLKDKPPEQERQRMILRNILCHLMSSPVVPNELKHLHALIDGLLKENKTNPIRTPSQPQDLIRLPKDLHHMWNQAITHLNHGDLKLAEYLLNQSKDILQELHQKADIRSEEKFSSENFRLRRVQVQINIVNILRGRYRASADNLQKMASTILPASLKKEVMGWLGHCLIFEGEYQKAVNELNNSLSSNIRKLKNNFAVFTIQNLALAYAYLGDFEASQNLLRDAQHMVRDILPGIPRNLKRKQYITEGHTLNYPMSTMDSLLVTEAKVNLIWGKYQEGLTSASKALDNMMLYLGGRHPKILETTKLKAHLLALNSKSVHAEGVCKIAIQGMEIELGINHPQTLEAKNILVFILRTQSRLNEAITISKSVCDSMTATLSPGHPLLLDAKAELAANYLSSGAYVSAEMELRQVIDQSQQRHTWTSPITLRYLSDLAHVYYRSEYFASAEKLALTVLQLQRSAYELDPNRRQSLPLSGILGQAEIPETRPAPRLVVSNSININKAAHCSDIVRPILTAAEFEYDLTRILDAANVPPRKRGLLDSKGVPAGLPGDLSIKLHRLFSNEADKKELDLILQGHIPRSIYLNTSPGSIVRTIHQRFSKLRVHPFLLHTLRVIAAIALKTDPHENTLLNDILKIILMWNEETLGESHACTLMSQCELALAERSGYCVADAERRLRQAYLACCRTAGKSHPDSLMMKRGLVITRCALGAFEDFEASLELAPEESSAQTKEVTPTGEVKEPISHDLEDIKAHSREVLTLQEEKLGAHHPESLKTLLWLFAMQLSSKDGEFEAHSTAGIILQRFRNSSVKSQRPLEANCMEGMLAEVYEGYGFKDKANRIREQNTHNAEERVEEVDSYVTQCINQMEGLVA